MARCHHCEHDDPHAAEFTDDVCPRCSTPQGRCPRCGEEQEHGVVCSACAATVDQYSALAHVFDDCLAQAASGKGKERHATKGTPFEEQLILTTTRSVGLGYPLGQAIKKIVESQRLLDIKGSGAAIAELQGAVNYVAAAIIKIQEES